MSRRHPDSEATSGQASLAFGPPRPIVRPMQPGERRSVLEVLGRAFHDDPVAAYLFPSEADRVARWARFCGAAMDFMGATAHVLTTAGLEGAAIWQQPGQPGLGRYRRLRTTLGFLLLMRGGVSRAQRLGELTHARHPREPHYYLATLGTDPPQQGRGVGGALLEPVLARCDREGRVAWLESSKERNVPFYQRFGFEVVEAIEIPDGPTLWAMRRPPAGRSEAAT